MEEIQEFPEASDMPSMSDGGGMGSLGMQWHGSCGALCPHGKVKGFDSCADCFESLLRGSCKSVKLIARQKVTLNSNIPCEHFAEKRRCRICKGSWICLHGVNKVYCAYCDGRRMCQVCLRVTLPRCYETCKRCREWETKVARANGMPDPDFSAEAARKRRRVAQ